MGEQGPVVPGQLGEAEPRVDDQLVTAHTPGTQVGHALAQLAAYVNDHVVVRRTVLHRVAVTTPVHDHERHFRGGYHSRHVCVGQASADVVHHGRACLNSLRCDRRPHGVNRDPGLVPGQLTDDRNDPAQLLFLAGAFGAGTGGLTAHVQDVGSLLQQLQTVGDPGLGGEPHTSV